MPKLFQTLMQNNRYLMLAGAAVMLGGAAIAAQRYRSRGSFHDENLDHEKGGNIPRPTSGHWIGSEAVLPSHIPAHLPSEQRAAMSNYLTNTHMNMQHGDMETLQKRALAHQHWSGVEHDMLETTRTALSTTTSPHFQMSSHMAHNERRLLADRADQMRTIAPDTANKDLSEEVVKTAIQRPQGIGPSYESLTDMLIQGKRGPLSREQSALGIESTIVGHHILKKDQQYAESNPRMQATRPIDPLSKKPSHQTSSIHGIDLSQDPGSQIRESLGLPIMSGTSGSASDVARSYNFTVDALKKDMPEGEFMSAHEHRGLLHDLTFNWMRLSAPVQSVRSGINSQDQKNNLRRISEAPPMAAQTHTYPEIVAGVDLTLDGNSSENLRASTHRALDTMKQRR